MKHHLKFSGTASSKLQYQINLSIIFNYILERGPISRAKISKHLKISAPAVSRIVDKLIEQSYIVETEKIKTHSGKRPILLSVNYEKGYVIGIDLGKQRLKIALSKFNNEIIDKYEGFFISNSNDIAQEIIKEIKNFLNNCKMNRNIISSKLKAICIGVPAVVNIDTGEIISAPLYKKWQNINLKEILEKEINVPVFIENDVNLSAIGEKYFDIGKNFRDFVFIEVSNGIGAGIIINNQLLRGSTGSAGEIGFSIINTENLDLKIDNKGFLENFASCESISRQAIKKLQLGKESLMRDMVDGILDNINPKIVCEAAINGDPIAKNIIENMINFLSIIIINLILVLNPQIIVLGGDLCNLPEVDKLIINPIRTKIEKSLPFKTPELKLSLLSDDTGVTGATFLAIESLLISEFPYKIENWDELTSLDTLYPKAIVSGQVSQLEY